MGTPAPRPAPDAQVFRGDVPGLQRAQLRRPDDGPLDAHRLLREPFRPGLERRLRFPLDHGHLRAVMDYNSIGDVPLCRCLEVVDLTRKASDADLEHAVQDYAAGESVEVLSRRYHLGGKRLTEVLKARGVMRDTKAHRVLAGRKLSATVRARTGLPDAEVVARYLAGESENGLARAYGTARTVIRARLLSAGVTPRAPREANRLLAAALTPEEQRQRLAAAHAAARGRPLPRAVQVARAQTTERLAREGQRARSAGEQLLQDWLAARGVPTVPQRAVGIYNVDLAAGAVAIELYGGTWHTTGRHAARAPERARYLFDQGWHLVIVWSDLRRGPLTEGAADYIRAFVEETRREPTAARQYRVLWGTGEEVARGGADADEVAAVVPRRGRDWRRP
jgi:hypothetical protein